MFVSTGRLIRRPRARTSAPSRSRQKRTWYGRSEGRGVQPAASTATATRASETTLTGTGDANIHPNSAYWSAPAGTRYDCLTGPSNNDFDLALYRWSGLSWSRMPVSQGTTSTENITYAGTAGYYYWRVYSYSGSGAYTLKIKRL